MTPSEVLLKEHQSIRDGLEVLEEICFLLSNGQEIIPEDIAALTDFLGSYTHDLHQKKEELFLFPAMENAGVSRELGHFAMLVAGHEIAATYLRHLAEAGRHAFLNRDDFIEAAESYIKMMLAHLEQEEKELFPLADQTLPTPVQDALVQELEKFEALSVDPGRHDEVEHILEYFRVKYLANQD